MSNKLSNGDKKCEHFMPGTYVQMNNRRGLVMSRHDSMGMLTVKWDDNGSTDIIRPIALNR